MMRKSPNMTYRIGHFQTSDIELQDLFKAWVAISVAFAIVLGAGASMSALFSLDFLSNFLIAAFTVGIGFLLHELGHKIVAQQYGCFAEFRSWDMMLGLAVIMSFLGFVLAAPGAVMIQGSVGRVRNGRISIAGPAVNLALALLFLALIGGFGGNAFFRYGFLINAWLGLFNLIPAGNLDGAKVLRWNRTIYASALVTAVALVFVVSGLVL